MTIPGIRSTIRVSGFPDIEDEDPKMTKRMDPEKKRKRAIIRRMSDAGRIGDWLTSGVLTETERAEVEEMMEEMNRDYEARKKNRPGWLIFDCENELGVGMFRTRERAVRFAETRAKVEGWGDGIEGLVFVKIELV